MKLTQGQLEVIASIREYLDESYKFFMHRDEMNSAVHESPVRYSPLTESAMRSRKAFVELIEQVNQ